MDEEGAAVIEDEQIGNSEMSNKKVRHRKKQLHQTIRKQMEFYFSDANLAKDRFLGKLIMEDPYIDISIFIRFNRIRALTTNIQDIASALRTSDILSVTEDGTKVFRTTPVKEKENTDDCTIYVEQLPPDAQHDWLKEVFSTYGNVAYVSIPKYRHSGKIKGFAFVEFETPEEANRTLEAFSERGCRLSSQIAPEKLCSISTFESEEGKEENKIGEIYKEISEKVGEEQDGVTQDQLSMKKRKRKKSKQENSEVAAENSEPDETEADSSVKNSKKKRFKDSTAEECEGETVEKYDDSVPKKKKRKSEESKLEETGKQNDTDKDAEDCQQSSDTETHPEKRKRKRRSGEDGLEEKVGSNLDGSGSKTAGVILEESEKKRRKRKSEEIGENKDGNGVKVLESVDEPCPQKKLKRNNEEENVDIQKHEQADLENERFSTAVEEKENVAASEYEETEEPLAEGELAEDGAQYAVKKKNRKRRKKHKKDKQDVEANRLQILSKREWKRLRNKYLDLQRAKMKCLKQYLGKNRWNCNSGYNQNRLQHASGQNQEKEDINEGNRESEVTSKQNADSKPRIAFTPGVIVRAVLEEPVMDVRKFKADTKSIPEVEYVDVIMGVNEAFIRCSTASAAGNLLSNSPWKRTEVLEGEEESEYWRKIFDDRTQKFGSKNHVKQRGRNKILRRAERELGKHIRFDD